jgi:hypothetical protein
MNANYLAIVLWVGSLIVQFVAYMILAAKQRGREEAKLAEITIQKATIGQLRDDTMKQRLMIENIATYLETSDGVRFRRD